MRNLLKTWLADNTVTDENNGAAAYILDAQDTVTRATDGSATPGRNTVVVRSC